VLTDEEYDCFLKALGTRIKQLRKDKKFNMRDIMIATGYYDAQWRKYESGGSMNFQSLLKIALALDVSLGELFDGLGQWPKLSVAEILGQHETKAATHRVDEPKSYSLDSSPEPSVQPSESAKTVSKKVRQKGAAQPRAGAAGRSRSPSPAATSRSDE